MYPEGLFANFSVYVADHQMNWQNLGRRRSAKLFHVKFVVTLRVFLDYKMYKIEN